GSQFGLWNRRSLRDHIVFDLLVHARQVNFKFAPDPDFRIDPYEAAGLLHDAIDRRKAQARSFARLLRGEKRLEDMSLRFGVHPSSGIDDDELDVFTGLQ